MNCSVSVCLITYNHGKYIKHAIESVLNQKCTYPIELIIGEDHSTDETRKICESFAQRNSVIKLLPELGKNIGAEKNMERVLTAVTGKYVAFLEGDDYWTDQSKLQKQITFLENNPDYSLIHCNCDYYYDATNVFEQNALNKYEVKFLEGDIYDYQLESNKIHTLTVMIRKDNLMSSYNEINAYNKKWLMGDKPLWLNISRNSKIGYLPESIGVYRIHTSSTVNTLDKKKVYEFMKSSFDINYFFIEKFGCKEFTKKLTDRKYNEFLIKSGYALIDKNIAGPAYKYFKSISMVDLEIRSMYYGSFNLITNYMARIVLKILKLAGRRKITGL